jgi:hypothetical protein
MPEVPAPDRRRLPAAPAHLNRGRHAAEHSLAVQCVANRRKLESTDRQRPHAVLSRLDSGLQWTYWQVDYLLSMRLGEILDDYNGVRFELVTYVLVMHVCGQNQKRRDSAAFLDE